MTTDEIEDAIFELMMRFGPNRQVEGSEQITAYIVGLLAAEREQCAKIAESHKCLAACGANEQIATAIRNRETK